MAIPYSLINSILPSAPLNRPSAFSPSPNYSLSSVSPSRLLRGSLSLALSSFLRSSRIVYLPHGPLHRFQRNSIKPRARNALSARFKNLRDTRARCPRMYAYARVTLSESRFAGRISRNPSINVRPASLSLPLGGVQVAPENCISRPSPTLSSSARSPSLSSILAPLPSRFRFLLFRLGPSVPQFF